MNKLEREYAQELELRKKAGEIVEWRFEEHKVRIGKGAFYLVDFWVMLPYGLIEMHEVKGRWEEAARVRFRAAVDRHWYYSWKVVTKPKGCVQFQVETVEP